jgi:hypothetical protein
MRRETRTAEVECLPSGVVRVRIRPALRQEMPDAQANFSAAAELTGGRRAPLLIDIRRAEPLPAEVRHYYTDRRVVKAFSALGLVVEASPLGRMMGNLYFRVTQPSFPVRLFEEESGALAWLAERIA